jgi:hypothetical protein
MTLTEKEQIVPKPKETEQTKTYGTEINLA